MKQTTDEQATDPRYRPTGVEILEALLVIYAEDMLVDDYGPWDEVLYFLFSRENKLVQHFFEKLDQAGCSFDEFFEKSKARRGSGIKAFSNWLCEGHFDPIVPYALAPDLRVIE